MGFAEQKRPTHRLRVSLLSGGRAGEAVQQSEKPKCNWSLRESIATFCCYKRRQHLASRQLLFLSTILKSKRKLLSVLLLPMNPSLPPALGIGPLCEPR
jgi:hypothetical protein